MSSGQQSRDAGDSAAMYFCVPSCLCVPQGLRGHPGPIIYQSASVGICQHLISQTQTQGCHPPICP
jgi:hypothetical protein